MTYRDCTAFLYWLVRFVLKDSSFPFSNLINAFTSRSEGKSAVAEEDPESDSAAMKRSRQTMLRAGWQRVWRRDQPTSFAPQWTERGG